MTFFTRLPKPRQYFILGVLLWIVVDWGTAGGFRIAHFQKYGPTLLIFYAGYPLVFSILVFRLLSDDGRQEEHWIAT